MKSTDNSAAQFKVSFDNDNTLIANVGDDLVTIVKPKMAELDAKGKTVVITDKYMLQSNSTSDYINDVIEILKSLEAKKIILATDINPVNWNCYTQVKSALAAESCTLEYQSTTSNRIHDRWWLCVENHKCICVGTSLNCIGKQMSTIQHMEAEDITEFEEELDNLGII